MEIFQESKGNRSWSPPACLEELIHEGESGVVVELIDTFLDDTAARLQVLSDACAREDFQTVSAEIHSLKGSCRQLEVDTMASTCQQIEKLVKEGSTGEILSLLFLFGEQSRLVGREMSAYRNRLQRTRSWLPSKQVCQPADPHKGV